jgi:hypothetical protein
VICVVRVSEVGNKNTITSEATVRSLMDVKNLSENFPLSAY